jgi:flotillin
MDFNLFQSFVAIGIGLIVIIALFLRRVVPTNEVHIVQSAKSTTSYGKDTQNGNSYYEWPSWIPVFGVTTVSLPMSVFDLDLQSYEAYDKGRLPFVVDVKAFFRISESNVAAQRVASFDELKDQLKAIVQGAVRVILASTDIEDILQGRSTFGEQFTREVAEQLVHWGVTAVKNIELMDIRDSEESRVIHNIMDKKKSHIEMESRTEVAKNKRIAEIAEIEAKREVDLQNQAALQSVGLRTVEAQREVALQNETAEQAIKEQQKLTKQKEMEVRKVELVKVAEIEKETQIIKSEQVKETLILEADGALEAKRKEAAGIQAEGIAKAEAEKAFQLAPVQAQIELAKEIGENKSYQEYLVTVRRVEAEEAVGIKQAEALMQANIKVIANSGDISNGFKSIGDVLSSKGGTAIGALLEGMNNTEVGGNLINKLTNQPQA